MADESPLTQAASPTLAQALPPIQVPIEELDIPLDRELFTRELVRELAGTLEEVVGLREVSGLISIVGQNIGSHINAEYKAALGVPQLSREQVRDVLIDLKRRIQGDFYLIEEDEEKIVLANCACPFRAKELGRSSLCMMTSDVFGSIAAENLGYAKVELQQTIAEGDTGCRVVVYLQPTPEAQAADGHEYFKGPD